MANRIGVFLDDGSLEYAEKFNIPFEVVDQLTGKIWGVLNLQRLGLPMLLVWIHLYM